MTLPRYSVPAASGGAPFSAMLVTRSLFIGLPDGASLSRFPADIFAEQTAQNAASGDKLLVGDPHRDGVCFITLFVVSRSRQRIGRLGLKRHDQPVTGFLALAGIADPQIGGTDIPSAGSDADPCIAIVTQPYAARIGR